MPDVSFDWSFPYPSQRMPVLARNVVATSQPLAAQAGLEMLRAGGNAMDAAVATAIALTVLEPTSNGIGSDAFALVWAGGGLHGLNASGRAPAALSADLFAGKDEVPQRGWWGVTVPGAVSAWVETSRRFGALPFVRLAEPAIRYARDGFPVAPQTASGWRRSQRVYRDFPAWQATFCPHGRGPAAGEIFRSPAHARTLEAIAESEGEAFYRGEIARAIALAAKDDGAWMTEADLAAHRADWVRPISTEYGGLTLHEIPPNGQGICALIALGIMRHLAVGERPVDSVESLHLQIEAMKLAFTDAHRYIADPETMDVEPAALLDDDYLRQRAALVDPARAGDPGHGTPLEGGTVLLCAADAEGNMVSFIQSNYTGFGSGVVIPDRGIAMQNRGCCFALEEGHPNRVGPGKRPYHTIIPAFVTSGEEPVMAFGVMGGFMQPQGHAQVMVRLTDYGQNPQTALDAPRWRVDGGKRVSIEPGFPDDVYEGLRALGHELSVAGQRTVSFGGGQAIHRLDDAYLGASDLRRDGQAAGY